MSFNKNSWITSGIIFVLAAAFTIFCGILIANMTGKTEKKDPENTDQQVAEENVDPPAQSDPFEEAASDESGIEIIESDSTEEPITLPPSDPHPKREKRNLSPLSAEQLAQIQGAYDGTVKTFYCTGAPDINNRPGSCNELFGYFAANFPDFLVYNSADPSQANCSFTFVLLNEYNNNTAAVLDILNQYGIKAVFFTDVAYCQANTDLIRRIIREGHEIGSLGASFPDGGLAWFPLENQMTDIVNFHQYMMDAFDYSMDKFLFGYDVYSDQSLALLKQLGYRAVFYSINYADYDSNMQINPDAFVLDMETRLHYGALYSLHTCNNAILTVLPNLINYIYNHGYLIEPVY